MTRPRSSIQLLFCLSLAILTLSVSAQKPTAEPAKDPFLGRWQSDEATIEFLPGGRITINGEKYSYKIKNSVITVSDDEGSLLFPYELQGDKLTVEYMGRAIVYKRLPTSSAGGNGGVSFGTGAVEGVVPEFVGKWCYMSSMSGSNSYMSSRCFVLNQNGTYEYSAESSTSGASGSTAGQSYDSGRWTATRTTLTAISSKHGRIVYPIQLRNHPKNGDAMIVVDGDAYVTAYKRRPW